jgi:multiple sugar transport system permease protein
MPWPTARAWLSWVIQCQSSIRPRPRRDLDVTVRFQGPYSAEWEVISAGVLIVIVPTLALFLFLQRWFYNGIIAGAVK